MTTDAMLKLAERCEQATAEQQREMLIAAAKAICKATLPPDAPVPPWLERWDELLDAGAYLDAAMTLVPEDLAVIQMHRLWLKDKAQLYDGFTCVGEGTAKTPALALCAAALKAKASQ